MCAFKRTALYLVGEGVAHDEGRVSHGTAQVHQAALGQQDDVFAALHAIAVDLKRKRRRKMRKIGSSPAARTSVGPSSVST